MGPFLWAWHPISTAALVQCPPIAGNASVRAYTCISEMPDMVVKQLQISILLLYQKNLELVIFLVIFFMDYSL